MTVLGIFMLLAAYLALGGFFAILFDSPWMILIYPLVIPIFIVYAVISGLLGW